MLFGSRLEKNVLSAVQGTVPGVTVISRPGQTPSINFRGRGNLGTSSPLYVIDGAIADNTFVCTRSLISSVLTEATDPVKFTFFCVP